MKHPYRLVALLAFNALVIPTAMSAPSYSVTYLGTLGGQSSVANDINDLGQVVGYSMTSTGETHAFLYSAGAMVDLGTLGGNLSQATGINNSGQIVGFSRIDGLGTTRAFVFAGGSMAEVGTLGGTLSVAYDINDSGQIVGYSSLSDGDIQGFLHSAGGMTALGTLGGGDSFAYGVNGAGQVVGAARTEEGYLRAFSYANGVMTDLGTLGGDASSAIAINDGGLIVGGAEYAAFNYYTRAFMYSGGVMTELNANVPWSNAADINNAGYVVGTMAREDFSNYGYLYRDGVIHDLNELIDPSLGLVIDSATAINSAGDIVATACSSSGCSAVLLSAAPVPEPGAWALFVAGLGLVGAIGRRRKTT